MKLKETSEFIAWELLSDLQDRADDHTVCPKCKSQLYFCDCPQNMACDIFVKYLDKIKELDA